MLLLSSFTAVFVLGFINWLLVPITSNIKFNVFNYCIIIPNIRFFTFDNLMNSLSTGK